MFSLNENVSGFFVCCYIEVRFGYIQIFVLNQKIDLFIK